MALFSGNRWQALWSKIELSNIREPSGARNRGRQEKGRYVGRRAGSTKGKPARAHELRSQGLKLTEVASALGVSDQHRETVFGGGGNSSGAEFIGYEMAGRGEHDEVRGFWLRAKDEPRQNQSGLLVFGAGWTGKF